jgi:hypothetical protein
MRERVAEFAKGLLRSNGMQCKNDAGSENDEPDQPHGAPRWGGWREV